MRRMHAFVALAAIAAAGVVIMNRDGDAPAADTPPSAEPENVSPKSAKYKHTNRLAKESSPYLLQHQHNPVDWYPWGKEAFERARKEDKPIFLSIGYSTCHWCHVMEHESFEDEEVAALMNKYFVCIKVDREERPDIDAVYMSVAQSMTGRGGWPMTILMTPDKKPFFAGTYYPKHGRRGMPGMMQLLPSIAEAWKTKRNQILTSSEQIKQKLTSMNKGRPGGKLDSGILERTEGVLRQIYDPEMGGFGRAPKFPMPHNLMFLLRQYAKHKQQETLNIVTTTLDHMRMGGVWDHLGYGFHRYSTDPFWLVPHFEKMLYDQALLTIAYTEAYQVTGNESYAQTAREILTYVLRDMQDKSGGFYSAEDADSDGEEGKFYVWTTDELKASLGAEAGMFIKRYNATAEGNYHDEATRQKTAANILHLDTAPDRKLFAVERKKLFELREKRIHPLKDDKILTDWNGLMIAAAARAGRSFDDEKYITAASKAADFIWDHVRDKRGRLLKRHRKGKSGLTAHLDDYAFMTWGLAELYEATFDAKYLKRAKELADTTIKHFQDDKNGGFYMIADDAEQLLVRQKEIYDGAIPSGNSVAAYALLRLYHMTGDERYQKAADGVINAFASQVNNYPHGHSFLMMAVQLADAEVAEAVIVGDAAGSKKFRKNIDRRFLPWTVVLHRNNDLAELAPFTKPLKQQNGKTTAYVCRNRVCRLPTNSPQQMLKNILGE